MRGGGAASWRSDRRDERDLDDEAVEPLLEAGRRPGLDDEDWDEPSAAAKDDSVKLLVSFVAMVFFGLGNKIFQKIQTIPMKNYPFFLNIYSTMIYIPVSFIYIIPMLYAGRISKEERAVPQYKFATMGFLDGVASLMQVFAVTKIASGALLILLSQAAIPTSMLISSLLLRTRYQASQYVGATVVMGGIVCVLYPSLSGGVSGEGSSTLIWAGVMMLSCIPMALSSVFKEGAMSDVDMDAMFLNGFIAIYQFLACIPSSIPAAVEQGIPIQDIPSNLRDGFRCYMGINSIVNATNPLDNDDCEAAPFDVNVYLFFNVFYNVLMILIVKYGSANIMFMALTLMVPLGNFAFSLPWVPGHQDLTIFDYSGLCIIMSGLVCYRFGHGIQRACGLQRDLEEGEL